MIYDAKMNEFWTTFVIQKSQKQVVQMLRPWNLEIILNVDSGKAVFLQIADAIIVAIKTGNLHRGDVIPGSRQLSLHIGVNRNTVVRAYEVLLAEGWLVAKERKGIFVSGDLTPIHTGKHPSKAAVTPEILQEKPSVVFDDGLPDSKQAPVDELARAYRQIFARQGRWKMMGYNDGSGHTGFREALARMLNYKRGMRLTADQLCITRGSQMAMFLCAQCLINAGDYVIIENPGYKPAWQAFEYAGAKLLPVSVDEDGLNTDELRSLLRRYKKIKAVYVTPHHQFPTTVTLSLARRLELVTLSNKYGFTIIEDDYDNEFHFGRRPILPVSSIENVTNFIYIGTMSKIVAPALRIGYLASSQPFIRKVIELRRIIDVQGDNIMEQAMLELIVNGNIRRHIKRATLAYKAKRDHFEQLLIKYLGNKVHCIKPDGGLAFWIVPPSGTDISKLAQKLLRQGVRILTPDTFSYDNPVNGIRLGYASLTEKQMEEGIKKMAALL